MRKAIAVTAVLAAGTFSTSLLAAPAGAEDTAVTFTIAGGGLSMSIPSNPSVKLTGSNLALGTTSVTGALNATTVTDQRGALASSWTVQVSSSDWVGPELTIPKANGTAYIDVPDVTGLAGMLTGGAVATSVATAATPAKLGAGTTAEKTLVAGTTAVSGSITYTPTVKVTIPADAPAGTYTGTVTQTAS